jgi:hypothetical protein
MKLDGKTRLVSFGCSFTSGHELIDHELLNITFEQCNELKQRAGSILEFDNYMQEKTGMTLKEIAKLSAKRTYAAKLSNKLNLKYKTYAWHGHGLEHNVLTFLQALHNGELNPETDLLFFGLTTPQRYLHFGGAGNDLTRVISDQVNTIDLYYNSYKIMQTYGYALKLIIASCKETNFDFIMQPIVDTSFMRYDRERNNFYSDMIEFWEFMPIFDGILEEALTYSIDPESNLHKFNWLVDNRLCGFKHPIEEVHEFFAEHLYDKIIKK